MLLPLRSLLLWPVRMTKRSYPTLSFRLVSESSVCVFSLLNRVGDGFPDDVKGTLVDQVPFNTGIGANGDCIQHDTPMSIVHIYTDSNKIFSDYHCVYLYRDSDTCGGCADETTEAAPFFCESSILHVVSVADDGKLGAGTLSTNQLLRLSYGR